MSRARSPLTIGWEAARANAVPALVIQAFMLAVLIGYYASPGVAEALNRLGEYKREHGLTFVLLASVVAGAVLPELLVILLFQGGRVRVKNLHDFLFNVPFWAFDGFLVDLMYRQMGVWFGATATVPVVAAKICVDQLGYNPFFAAPYGVWGYAWKNSGYSFVRLRALLNWSYYRDHAIPVLIATWAVWIPLMAIIYSLPVPLQFPLFALALSFWVLLMTYMTNRFAGKIEADAELAVSAAE